ncbi:MAG: EcsC family protein [Betaproteobacteria bacterium]|nr:EcsC family protein [Betaproteobacteria bacterium]
MNALTQKELVELKRAKALLENPGLAARLSAMLGTPFERGMAMLPKRFQGVVHKASEAAMMRALDLAVKSHFDNGTKGSKGSRDKMHMAAVAASGAVGGAFGLAALGLELPVSTTIMLRSIADIARSEGENILHIDTKLACLTVFALGGRSEKDDAAESGYFAARVAMAGAVTEASKFLAEKGFSKAGAPALVRLVSLISARFGIVVSEKAAAQAIPILGAASGALINTLFIEHFQNMARGHFTVRRLEKIHGAAPVKDAYLEIR